MSENYKGKGALDAFLNLFSLITLGWLAISTWMVLSQIINKYLSFNEAEMVKQFTQDGLKMGVASLIIVAPIFLLIINILHREYKKDNLNHQSGVYRWLTYVVLLVTALNILGRLIQLIYQFLGGEYTLASILKILVVLFIAGGIFGYYFYDLKRTDYSKASLVSQIFMWVVILVSLICVIAGFMMVETPVVSRMRKQDQARVNHLTEIKNYINNEYNVNKAVPENLTDPKFSRYVDPKTNQPYEYRKIADNQYELCAEFALDYSKEEVDFFGVNENWSYHTAGRQCFEQKAIDYTKTSPEPIKNQVETEPIR